MHVNVYIIYNIQCMCVCACARSKGGAVGDSSGAIDGGRVHVYICVCGCACVLGGELVFAHACVWEVWVYVFAVVHEPGSNEVQVLYGNSQCAGNFWRVMSLLLMC